MSINLRIRTILAALTVIMLTNITAAISALGFQPFYLSVKTLVGIAIIINLFGFVAIFVAISPSRPKASVPASFTVDPDHI